MKTTRSISIDTDVWYLAKRTYDNVSQTVEKLLRADLEMPHNKDISNSRNIKEIKDKANEMKTQYKILIAELKALESKKKEDEEGTYEYKHPNPW